MTSDISQASGASLNYSAITNEGADNYVEQLLASALSAGAPMSSIVDDAGTSTGAASALMDGAQADGFMNMIPDEDRKSVV